METPRATAGTQQELLNAEFPEERGCSSSLDITSCGVAGSEVQGEARGRKMMMMMMNLAEILFALLIP